MSIQVIEEAIKTRDVAKLWEILALVSNGLRAITNVQISQAPKSHSGRDPELEKRITVLALDFMKRHGEQGKVRFLNQILVPALGVHKTFKDCTDEDLRLIEAKLLEVNDA